MSEISMPKTLDRILKEDLPLPPDGKVLPLPIAHLTTVKSFRTTLDNNGSKLKPKHCNVFGRKLLYFSYGGVFHRYKDSPTNDPDWLPIAILFDPDLLKLIDHFFPYDSGAANKNLYGDFNDDLIQFDKYRILNDGSKIIPSKLIYNVYGNNDRYLQGMPILEDLENSQIDILITLISFYRKDLTPNNVDGRQRAIECLTSKQIDLKKMFEKIIWVGLPETERGLNGSYSKICSLGSIDPDFDSDLKKSFYKYRRGQRPDEMAAVLQEKANEFVENYL